MGPPPLSVNRSLVNDLPREAPARSYYRVIKGKTHTPEPGTFSSTPQEETLNLGTISREEEEEQHS